MADKDRAELSSDLPIAYPDNTSGLITPEILRNQQQSIVDSLNNLIDEGFQRDSGESIFVSKGGDDTSSGVTTSKPVLTNVQGLTNAGTTGATTVNTGDGNYDETIVMPDGVNLRGKGATLTSSGDSEVTLTAGGSSTVEIGFLSAQGDDSTCYLVNGKNRSQLITNTIVLGSFASVKDGVIGVDIQGANDDIPIQITNGECQSTNATLVRMNGTATTPPKLNFGSFTNAKDGLTLVDMSSSDPSQRLEIFLSFVNDPTAGATGLNLFKGNSGILSVFSPGIDAPGQQVATVESGLKFILSTPTMAGNITVDDGGDFVSGVSEYVGDLVINGIFTGFIGNLKGQLTLGPTAVFDGTIQSLTLPPIIDPGASVVGRIGSTIYDDVIFTGSVKLLNNKSLILGDNDDLVIFSTGSLSRITNNVGNLEIITGTGGDLILKSTGSTNNIIAQLGTDTSATSHKIINNSGASLLKVFGGGQLVAGAETADASAAYSFVSTTGGMEIPGGTEAQRDDIASPKDGLLFVNFDDEQLEIVFGGVWKKPQPETSPGGSDTEIQFNSNGVFGGIPNIKWDGTTNLIFDDNTVAGFGTGNDLNIYHTGATSVIDNSTGDLFIRNFGTADDIVIENQNGAANIINRLGSVPVGGIEPNVTSVTTFERAGAGGARITLKSDDLESGGILIANATTNNVASFLYNDNILNGWELNTPNGLVVMTDSGNLGAGLEVPISRFHAFENTTNTDATNGITIEQDGTGDASLHFLLTGGQRWSMGIDNDDSDFFKISESTDLGTNTRIRIRPGGNVVIGEAGFPESRLHVASGSAGAVSANTNTVITVENVNDAWISIFAPDNRHTAVVFGGPQSNAGGGIFYNEDQSAPNGFMFRTNDVDDRMVITSSGDVVIGRNSSNAKLEVVGTAGVTIGGFASGQFHVTSPSALVNANAVITGHNSFGGNKQLWYFGSASSSNDDITIINRQNADLTFATNNIERLKITAAGLVQIGNLQLDGNTISTTSGDLDLITGTGGVFKFNSNAIRAGLDAVEYVEMGHGGGNGFINAVGDGGLDFRFEGTTLATFTDFGHLHLMTNVDEKHTLKFITNDNLNDTGIAWENSSGNFSQTIFRSDIGSNRSDLFFAIGSNVDIDLLTNAIRIDGSDANIANLEFFKDIKLTAYPNTRDDGTPINILGTDADGNLISGPNEVIHIGGNFTDTTDQAVVSVGVFQSVTFNQNRLIDGMTHTVGSAEFTIDADGVYNLEIAPQVGQVAGAANVEFQLLKNGALIVDSGIQFSVGANSQTLPYLRWKERFVATDTYEIQWASDSANTSLDNLNSMFGGANIPSIMHGVTHVGS